MTDDWINSLSLDFFNCVKQMMIAGKQFRQKSSGENETASLHTTYRTIALMLNIIFCQEHGKFYKLSWIPLIYHVAMQTTIFNWADIMEDILSSRVAAALGGLTQRKLEFYKSSFFIECILCTHPFSNLNCDLDPARTPIYSTYQILWEHKYSNFYKTIREDFLLPLYELIFLKDSNCMPEGAMETASEYGDYFSPRNVCI